MDPNTALTELRDALEQYWVTRESGLNHAALEYADTVAEHTEALDQWLAKGGFLPDKWQR